MGNDREKNPLFVPALIVTAFLPIGIFLTPVDSFALYAMLVTPYIAFILSFVGLVIAKKLNARFWGCAFCLVVSVFEIYYALWFPAYMSRPG